MLVRHYILYTQIWRVVYFVFFSKEDWQSIFLYVNIEIITGEKHVLGYDFIIDPISEPIPIIESYTFSIPTPNEEIYLNIVDTNEKASIYRANVQSRTWLNDGLYPLSKTIPVGNIDRVTNQIAQSNIAPTPVSGVYSIGLTADKDTVTGVKVLNVTTGLYIDTANLNIVIENLSPILKITDGAYITAGDSLTITSFEGNLLYINGEQIRFTTIDFATNAVGGLQRGTNGTSIQSSIPKYTEVYGLLSANRLADTYYNQTWNSYVFNPTLGDPLQISNTVPAQFLSTDVT